MGRLAVRVAVGRSVRELDDAWQGKKFVQLKGEFDADQSPSVRTSRLGKDVWPAQIDRLSELDRGVSCQV